MEKVTLFTDAFSVVKRLPEHVQVDNPEVLKKLAKKLERQQVKLLFSIFSFQP